MQKSLKTKSFSLIMILCTNQTATRNHNIESKNIWFFCSLVDDMLTKNLPHCFYKPLALVYLVTDLPRRIPFNCRRRGNSKSHCKFYSSGFQRKQESFCISSNYSNFDQYLSNDYLDIMCTPTGPSYEIQKLCRVSNHKVI